MAAQRKRTIRLYRIAEDGRRLLAGTIAVRPSASKSAGEAGYVALAA